MHTYKTNPADAPFPGTNVYFVESSVWHPVSGPFGSVEDAQAYAAYLNGGFPASRSADLTGS